MDRTGTTISRLRVLSGTDGLTLLEVLVALVLFATAMLVGGRTIVGFVHQVGVSEARALANEYALQEMERVRLLPYDEVAAITAAPVPEAPQFTRSVDVKIVGESAEALYGYKLITVIVESPAAIDPVSVSTAIAE
jgi:prepilin-type N-terminal cleavage/methylation domain-containing protein